MGYLKCSLGYFIFLGMLVSFCEWDINLDVSENRDSYVRKCLYKMALCLS